MDQTPFQKALSNFAGDVAAGGAIRHLTDRGYTLPEIEEHLDYPVPRERIAKEMYRHLLAKGVIRETEPGHGDVSGEVTYVREYDSYGRSSLRRVVRPAAKEEREYLSCEFGCWKRQDPQRYRSVLASLDDAEAAYIESIPWPPVPVWHEADRRMRAIMEKIHLHRRKADGMG